MEEAREIGEVRAAETGSTAATTGPKAGETPVRQIRKAKRATRRKFSAEDKIRIVMEGIRGELPISELCRREQLQTTVYYRWLKDFMEAGKRRLRGDMQREAGREEVSALKEENSRLKHLVADYALDIVALKKSLLAEQ